MQTQSRHFKKAAASCLRAVARHSPALAQTVVHSGAVATLVTSVEDFDVSVKETAAWALGYIAAHEPDLAQQVVDAGAIPPLAACVNEQEESLKRIAASAFGDIAKHSSELAQLVVDAGPVPHIAKCVMSSETKLRRQAFVCLANIARHSAELAEVVVQTGIFPKMLTSLKFPDDCVKKYAALLVKDVCKHTPELAQLVVSYGSVAALVDHIAESEGQFRLPSVMAVGFVASFSETLASTVIAEHAVSPLVEVFRRDEEDVLKSAAAWSLTQLGKHTSHHANAVAETGVLIDWVDAEENEKSSTDLKAKCRQAVKTIVSKLTDLTSLDSLVQRRVEEDVMRPVLEQLSSVLTHDPQARSQFVHSGGLALLQQMAEEPESLLTDAIDAVNKQYPEEIVMHYSPSYSQRLLEKLEAQTVVN